MPDNLCESCHFEDDGEFYEKIAGAWHCLAYGELNYGAVIDCPEFIDRGSECLIN